MKKITIFCISVLTAFVISSFLPTNNEEAVYSDMVRLHVLAHSDETEEQELKLKVRDSVLQYITENDLEINNTESVLKTVEANLDEIEDIAKSVVNDNGYNHNVTAEIGREVYPEREYEGFKLPAGEYYSLRIKIGAAEGKNWWCVLFPPLCTEAATNTKEVFIATGFSEEQYKTVTETNGVKYKVKFKIIEIIEAIIRGEE